jgi:methionyl-tRNA formyltransferase
MFYSAMLKQTSRLVFMGTPDFAVPALLALIKQGHEILCVYCQPPKPAGRGQELRKSPVQLAAEQHNIPVRTPKSLKNEDAQKEFASLNADLAVVAAYGLILPKAVLEAPKLGCINIHASLLPRWRGAAPIHRALLAGDAETGITIMQMDEGLDTGAMLIKRSIPITLKSTAQTLHDELAALGAAMVVEAVAKLQEGTLKTMKQPEAGTTYAAKLEREEGKVVWTQEANFLARKARAFNPWPGLFFESKGGRIKILEAEAVDGTGTPGTLLDDQFTIACGKGALRLLKVQREGKSAMDGAAFLRGFSVKPGEAL